MQRECGCGNHFIPRFERQMRCMYCILEEEPPLPSEGDREIERSKIIEWFIYHWHHIRKAACKTKGIPFTFDDGIVK